MRIRVAGGTLVEPSGMVAADLIVVDGRIVAWVDRDWVGESDELIDASGQLIFAGFIDPHVHSRDPGFPEKEDFAHLTQAAAAGGVTTVFEMPNVIPPLSSVDVLEERRPYHEQSAVVDFGLWGISLGRENIDEIPKLIEQGVIGIKLFWGYALDKSTKELVYNTAGRDPADLLPPPENDDVLELFHVVARANGLLAAHCEDRGVIEHAARTAPPSPSPYEDLLASRPDTAEAAAIALGIEFAHATGCRFHVVHVSSRRGLAVVRDGQRRGVDVSAETCPHYLTLTDASFAQVGSAMKVFPPVRREDDREALWKGVSTGVITSIGSDHAPHHPSDQEKAFAAQPAGAPGVETMVPLMLNEAWGGRIGYQQLASLLSEGTARRYGVYPKKGSLRPGSDADLTLVEPSAEWTIRNEDLHSKSPTSPWHGFSGHGKPVRTIVRGVTVMIDGALTGERVGRHVVARRATVQADRELQGGMEEVVG